MLRFLIACAAGIALLAALEPKLRVAPLSSEHRAATNATSRSVEHPKSTRHLLSPEQEAEAAKERTFALRQLDADETILHASSYNARADAYCRSEAGNPMHLSMAFSNGRSGEEVEAYYRKLLATESRTREEEEARQQKLQVVGELVANYEGNVQECKGMLLNEFEHMPSDEELQREVKSLKAQILDIDTNGPQF